LKIDGVQNQLPLIFPDSPLADEYCEDGADLAFDGSDNKGIDFIAKIAGIGFGGRSFGVQIDARCIVARRRGAKILGICAVG